MLFGQSDKACEQTIVVNLPLAWWSHQLLSFIQEGTKTRFALGRWKLNLELESWTLRRRHVAVIDANVCRSLFL